jgi:hypothetical protein
MTLYRTFPTLQEARDYRHANGTGGWIFAPNMPADVLLNYVHHECILFPPEFTPASIFRHPFTVGRDGELICN